MGERKCAFEGCNALEFRTSGYCLRHKEEAPLGGIGKDEASGERDSVPRIHGKSARMGVGRRFLRWPHIAVFADPSVCIAGFVRRHFS